MEADQKDPDPAGSPSAPISDPPPEQSASEQASTGRALESLVLQLEQLFDWVTIYLTSRVDAIKLGVRRGVRRGIVLIVIAVVAVLCASSLTVTAGVLLCIGISDALGALFGHKWAGELTTGGLVLGVLAVGSVLALRSMDKSSMQRTVQKYKDLRTRSARQAKPRDGKPNAG